MKCAVVTGAAGFVGCNLVEALIAHGYFVMGWSDQNRSIIQGWRSRTG